MQALNWNDKIQVQKGDFAENIVHEYLERQGFIVYKPITDGSHSFDRLAIKDRKEIVICEIKAKAKLNKFDETGIDLRLFNEYKTISEKYNIPVFIFFVDEMLAEIYGNWINILENNSRIVNWKNKMILFKMKDMRRHIYDLNEEEVKYLKQKSSRNHYYIQ